MMMMRTARSITAAAAAFHRRHTPLLTRKKQCCGCEIAKLRRRAAVCYDFSSYKTTATTTSTRRQYHAVSFSKTGEPIDVLEYHKDFSSSDYDECAGAGAGDDVRVQMLHAPWNPADVNTVQGRYASPYTNDKLLEQAVVAVRRRQTPSSGARTVAGSEGWGRVLEQAKSDDDLQVGDYVTMGLPGLGTLRSEIVVPDASSWLVKIDQGAALEQKVGSAAASTLFQLGGTALRMLSDFVVKSSEEEKVVVVFQNAANSAVGYMVQQIAPLVYNNKELVIVVSLVRRSNRTEQEFEQLKAHLLQATPTPTAQHFVLAQEDLDKQAIKDVQAQVMERVAAAAATVSSCLALNAVGGDAAKLLLQLMRGIPTTTASPKIMVTYGGMSMQPVTISTPELVFANLQLSGYWHSRWMVEQYYYNDRRQRHAMMNQLVDWVLQDKLVLPLVHEYRLEDFKAALLVNAQGDGGGMTIRRKVVFDCRESKTCTY